MQNKESRSEEGCQEVIAGALYLDWHVTFPGRTDTDGAQPSHPSVLASIHGCRLLAPCLPQPAEPWAGEAGRMQI